MNDVAVVHSVAPRSFFSFVSPDRFVFAFRVGVSVAVVFDNWMDSS